MPAFLLLLSPPVVPAAVVPAGVDNPCPVLEFGDGIGTLRSLGPVVRLQIPLTDAEAAVMHSRPIIRLADTTFFAGKARYVIDDGAQSRVELGFEPESLEQLAKGGDLSFVMPDGTRIERKLTTIDARPLHDCLKAILSRSPISYPVEMRRNWSFVPLPADHRARLRGRGYLQRFYPAQALRERREGLTQVRVRIGANGSVSECEVVGSSGHADLDEAACRMVRDDQYLPATDAQGQGIEGVALQPVRWKMAE